MDNVEYYESKKLAQCFIAPLAQSIPIPGNIFEDLQPLGKNLVAIIPGESKKMTFFLTNADQVLFVRLILDKASLNEHFFTSLRENLKQLEITNLFSTGLCFKDEVCVWEGVFEFDDDSKLNMVKSHLSQVTHVNKAKFDKIRV